MRYLVFSDTHGHVDTVSQWFQDAPDAVNAVVSAGDFYRDGLALAQQWGLPYYGAQGNNDLEPASPWHTIWDDGAFRVGVIHSHQWPVHRRLDELTQWGHENGCQIVIFGHSHVRFYQPGVVSLLNPGAVHRPRNGQPPTAVVMDLNPDRTWSLHWILLSKN
ncbi:MAG: metallophosphoesterase family protein [Sulfobacillus sp.]